MIKKFMSGACVAAAICMISGSAWASKCAFGTTTEIRAGTDTSANRSIASESCGSNYDVTVDGSTATPNGNAGSVLVAATTNVLIGLQASWGLNTGDEITITFGNAKYLSADAKLVGCEHPTLSGTVAALNIDGAGDGSAGNGDTGEVVEVASNFGSLDTTQGVSSITMRVNNGLTLDSNMFLYLVTALPTYTDNATTPTISTAKNPKLRIPSGTAADSKVTVSISAKSQGGSTIGAATCSNNILETKAQFGFGVTTAASSVIDVEATVGSRKNFDWEAALGAGDTTLNQSNGKWYFDNDSTSVVEDFITLGGSDTLKVTLTSSTDFSQVDYSSTGTANWGVFLDMGGAWTAAGTDVKGDTATKTSTAISFNLIGTTNITAAAPGGMGASHGNKKEDDCIISILGTDTVSTRTWSLGAELQFNASQDADTTYSAVTSHVWTLNGMQAKVPYMVLNNSTYTNVFKITNDGENAATLDIDAIVWKLGTSDSAAATYSITSVKTIPAKSCTTVLETDITTALAAKGWTAGSDTWHIGMTLTLPAPQNTIHIGIFQKDVVGRTIVPVLYNTNNSGDGRVWQ